jgi:hypothetical protein
LNRFAISDCFPTTKSKGQILFSFKFDKVDNDSISTFHFQKSITSIGYFNFLTNLFVLAKGILCFHNLLTISNHTFSTFGTIALFSGCREERLPHDSQNNLLSTVFFES